MCFLRFVCSWFMFRRRALGLGRSTGALESRAERRECTSLSEFFIFPISIREVSTCRRVVSKLGIDVGFSHWYSDQHQETLSRNDDQSAFFAFTSKQNFNFWRYWPHIHKNISQITGSRHISRSSKSIQYHLCEDFCCDSVGARMGFKYWESTVHTVAVHSTKTCHAKHTCCLATSTLRRSVCSLASSYFLLQKMSGIHVIYPMPTEENKKKKRSALYNFSWQLPATRFCCVPSYANNLLWLPCWRTSLQYCFLSTKAASLHQLSGDAKTIFNKRRQQIPTTFVMYFLTWIFFSSWKIFAFVDAGSSHRCGSVDPFVTCWEYFRQQAANLVRSTPASLCTHKSILQFIHLFADCLSFP